MQNNLDNLYSSMEDDITPIEEVSYKRDYSEEELDDIIAEIPEDKVITEEEDERLQKEKLIRMNANKTLRRNDSKYRENYINELMDQQVQQFFQENGYMPTGKQKRAFKRKVLRDFDKKMASVKTINLNA